MSIRNHLKSLRINRTTSSNRHQKGPPSVPGKGSLGDQTPPSVDAKQGSRVDGKSSSGDQSSLGDQTPPRSPGHRAPESTASRAREINRAWGLDQRPERPIAFGPSR